METWIDRELKVSMERSSWIGWVDRCCCCCCCCWSFIFWSNIDEAKDKMGTKSSYPSLPFQYMISIFNCCTTSSTLSWSHTLQASSHRQVSFYHYFCRSILNLTIATTKPCFNFHISFYLFPSKDGLESYLYYRITSSQCSNVVLLLLLLRIWIWMNRAKKYTLARAPHGCYTNCKAERFMPDLYYWNYNYYHYKRCTGQRDMMVWCIMHNFFCYTSLLLSLCLPACQPAYLHPPAKKLPCAWVKPPECFELASTSKKG